MLQQKDKLKEKLKNKLYNIVKKEGNFHIKTTRTNIFLTLTTTGGAVVFSCSGGIMCKQKKMRWKLWKTWAVSDDLTYFMLKQVVNLNYRFLSIYISGLINKWVWKILKIVWRFKLGGKNLIFWCGVSHNGLWKKKKRRM